MGVFEGHMARMAEGFRAIRTAELELAGEYRPAEHDEFFTYFDWRDFSDDEWELCPPVVAVGAMPTEAAAERASSSRGTKRRAAMASSGPELPRKHTPLLVDVLIYTFTQDLDRQGQNDGQPG